MFVPTRISVLGLPGENTTTWVAENNSHYLLALGVRSLKSKSQWGCAPSETCRGILPCHVLASGGLLAIFDVPWRVAASPQSSVLTWPSLFVSVCSHGVLFIRTPATWD